MEICYLFVTEKKLVNRGFVSGPFCTIYGFGALSVYFILKPFENNLLILFIMGIIVPSIIEYFTGWLMEVIFKTTWWDYSNQRFNIKGRVCLLNSIIWGFLTIILFLYIQPLVNLIVSLYSIYLGKILAIIVIIIYLIDYCTTCYYAMDLKLILHNLSDIRDDFVYYAQLIKLPEHKGEIMDYLENRNPIEFINVVKEKLGKSIQLNKEKFIILNTRYDSLKSRMNIIHGHLFKAFPNLKLKIYIKEKNDKKRRH